MSESSYLSQRITIELREAYEAVQDGLNFFLARYNLTHPKFRLLIQLRMAGEEGLSQSELSLALGVSNPNITGLVDRLVRDGWVVRGPDPRDRRVTRNRLTVNAVAMLEQVIPGLNSVTASATQKIPDSEKVKLIELLQALRQGFEEL